MIISHHNKRRVIIVFLKNICYTKSEIHFLQIIYKRINIDGFLLSTVIQFTYLAGLEYIYMLAVRRPQIQSKIKKLNPNKKTHL